MPMPWYAYLLRCGDGTLYAGATNDVEVRFKAHEEGRGAKYTRGRGPLTLVWKKKTAGRSAALRLEARIKRMTRQAKLDLLKG